MRVQESVVERVLPRWSEFALEDPEVLLRRRRCLGPQHWNKVKPAVQRHSGDVERRQDAVQWTRWRPPEEQRVAASISTLKIPPAARWWAEEPASALGHQEGGRRGCGSSDRCRSRRRLRRPESGGPAVVTGQGQRARTEMSPPRLRISLPRLGGGEGEGTCPDPVREVGGGVGVGSRRSFPNLQAVYTDLLRDEEVSCPWPGWCRGVGSSCRRWLLRCVKSSFRKWNWRGIIASGRRWLVLRVVVASGRKWSLRGVKPGRSVYRRWCLLDRLIRHGFRRWVLRGVICFLGVLRPPLDHRCRLGYLRDVVLRRWGRRRCVWCLLCSSCRCCCCSSSAQGVP